MSKALILPDAMEIATAQRLKAEMERAIEEAIGKFESETGLAVGKVEYYRETQTDASGQTMVTRRVAHTHVMLFSRG